MATVVDALVVTLGLDPKQYKQGQKEAVDSLGKTRAEAERVAKDIEARGQQAAEFFGKLRKEALALLAVFTAGMGIKSFTEHTIGKAEDLGYLSDNLKKSTEELDAWGRAAERAGGTQAGMMAQLKESASEVANRNMGGHSESLDWFFRLGGKQSELRDGNSYLLERSRIISDIYKVDPAKAALAAKNMGISEENFNLLKQGPDAVMALVQAQEKNSRFTRQQAEEARQLHNRWLDLKDNFEKTGTVVLLRLMPTFEMIVQKLIQLGDWIAQHRDDIKDWIDRALVATREFVQWADKAAQSVGGWKNVLIALVSLRVGVGLLQLAATLAGIAASLGTIGAAGTGGAALGVLGKMGKLGGAAGALLYDFINPKEANSNEEYMLHGRWDGGDKRGEQIVANALGDLLYKGEGTYNSVNLGVRGGYRTGTERLDRMTVGEVMERQARGEFNAAGKYQIIKGTLADAVRSMGLTGREFFGEGLQDRIYREYLIKTKRPNLFNYISGRSNDLDAALRDASKEWASIANPDTGASYYSGIGNNRASISTVQARNALMADRAANSAGSHVETTFNGPITINTQATDAKGIAADFTSEISTQIATQSNTGLN